MGISVLGPIEVTIAGRVVPLPAKQGTLLAILALQPNRTVSSDRLIEALWGEDASPDLAKTLQTHVFQLRRRLDTEAADGDDAGSIVTDGHGYRLDIEPRLVDASAFVAQVADARSVSQANPEHAAATLTGALALWRGPEVAETGSEPAATAELERLQELRASATDELVRLRLELGETDALVADLRRLLSEAPYREQLWASLMLALARSGGRAQALLAYRDAEAALRRELDVEPSRELRELAARIRDDDPSLAAAVHEVAPEASAGSAPPAAAGVRVPGVRRRGPILALGGIAIVVVFVVGLAWTSDGSPGANVLPTETAPSPTLRPEVLVVADSLVALDEEGRAVDAAEVGALPDGVVEAGGSLWVANTTDGEVTRVDPVTFKPVDTIQVGASPTGIAAGFGAVWVANSGDGTVSRINASSGDVVWKFTFGVAPFGVATDDSWVWVTDRLDGSLSRIDPADNSVATFPVGQVPQGVTATADAIWVADYEAGELVRVDRTAGDVGGHIDVGNGPTSIATDGVALWVVDTRDNTLSRVDPASGAVKRVFDLRGDPGGLAVGAGGVWVAVASPPAVVRVDVASGEETRYELDGSPRSVSLAAGRPVITIRAAPTAHTGGTLRIVSGEVSFPGSPDPMVDGFGGLTLLTNDGLLGYRRVGGPDSTTLEPDLAAGMPEVSDDGLSYLFRLQPAIRFSTGAPVRASDVVRSIERAASAYGPDGDFGTIVGAADCAESRPCDLGEGIVADDGAGTVTFHLTRRDPLFLHALAWLAIVPADTPFGEQTAPLPATGPYMFSRFGPDGIELVRNPGFEPWSPAAQPEGYPDVITWSPVPDGSDPWALVEAGEADVVVDERALSSARVSELATKYPDQLHAHPGTRVFVEVMNTKVPPFDDPAVRHAVNLAIDRDAALEAYGGPIQGRITCQVMPPTFPGYAPYCPFTVSHDASGTWRAADPDLARQLIAEAGAAGERVTVYGSTGPGHAEMAEYMVGLLNRLGFKATKHLVAAEYYYGTDGYLSADHPAAPDMGMAGRWWTSGVVTASSQFLGVFTCPDYPGTPYYGAPPSELCDPEVDRLVTAALALDAAGRVAEANATWQAVDRRVTDLAPLAAILTPTDVSFVSSRVGNFQHHLIWGYLLDQMWVN